MNSTSAIPHGACPAAAISSRSRSVKPVPTSVCTPRYSTVMPPARLACLPLPRNQPCTARSRLCTGLTLMASPFLLAPAIHGASLRRRIAPSCPPCFTIALANACGATKSSVGATIRLAVGLRYHASSKAAYRSMYGLSHFRADQSSKGTASNTITNRPGWGLCRRKAPLISLNGAPHLYTSPNSTWPGIRLAAPSRHCGMLVMGSPVRVMIPSGRMMARQPSYLGIMMYSSAGRSSSVGYCFLNAAHCSLSALGARLYS